MKPAEKPPTGQKTTEVANKQIESAEKQQSWPKKNNNWTG
jgi:hypothetical protein